MKTTRQNCCKVSLATFFMCIIEVKGANLAIAASTIFPIISTNASLTCSIPSFIGGAEWITHGVSLTLCFSGSCSPPSSGRYQYSTNASAISVTIPSLDIAQDETTWTCAHDGGADTGFYNLIVYKIPSALSISGPTSSVVTDGVTVNLSVSTGCIHPYDSAHYNVAWKYVEPGSAVEKLFGTGITQNFTLAGACANAEDNIIFNLYLTNRMNTGTTTLYISQIKMIFTMAGIDVTTALNVAYNVTDIGTATTTAPSGNQLALGLGLGIGLGAPSVTVMIIVIVVLVMKFNKDETIPLKPTGDKPLEKQPEPTGKEPDQIPLKPTSDKPTEATVIGETPEQIPQKTTSQKNKIKDTGKSEHL